MSSSPQTRTAPGFSLLELLVSVVILALLAALAFPLGAKLRMRSQEARCLQHLHQAGATLTVAIWEKGGVLDAWYSGSTGGEFWNTMLLRDGYLTARMLESQSCPGIPYADASGNYNGRHYGIYMPDTTNNLVDFRTETGALSGRAYRIKFSTVAAPGSTIFLADSVTSAGAPTIRIFRSDSASFASGAFHGRHGGRVNLFFYDGHVEGADSQRLYALGVRKIYDEHLTPKTLTP